MNQYDEKIKSVAMAHGVDKDLLKAIVIIESSGQPNKNRFEPNFIYTSDIEVWAKKLGITALTEDMNQKTSWGLCQVMGGTARWLGFTEDLPALVDPVKNLTVACIYLKKLQGKYSLIEDIAAAYNAGSARFKANGEYENQGYVDKIIAEIHKP